jgi:hypothetical protein
VRASRGEAVAVGSSIMAERIPDRIKLAEVEITRDGVFELARGLRSHFVRRTTFRRIGAAHGCVSERAALLIVLGPVLLIAGIWLGIHALAAAATVDPAVPGAYPRGGAAFTFARIAFGVVMLRQGLRLRLEAPDREHRLPIGGAVSAAELRGALAQAASELGYEVATADLDRLEAGDGRGPYRGR